METTTVCPQLCEIFYLDCNFGVTDNVEKAAEAAIEVIDSVAEATEKVAVDVAEAFPGNETLKQAATKIKAIADEIEEDADKAEALIEKVSFYFYPVPITAASVHVLVVRACFHDGSWTGSTSGASF